MHSNQYRFSSAEVYAFTFCSTITLGVSMLPYAPMADPVRDPWLSLILAVLPYMLFGLLLSIFLKRYQHQEFFDILKQRLFAPLYYLIMIYFAVSSAHFASLLSLSMIFTVQKHLLVNTLPWLLYIPWFLFIGCCLHFGIQTIVTFLRLYIVFEVIVLLAVFLISFVRDFNFIYIAPIFTTDFTGLWHSAITDIPWYGGVVSLLAMIHLAKSEKKPGRIIQLAMLSVMLVYVLLAFAAIGTFGYEESLLLTSPIHSLIQTFTTYGQFQRLDLLFMILWTTSFFKMTLIQLWFSMVTIKKMVPAWNKIPIIVILTGSLFVMLCFQPDLFGITWDLYTYNIVFFSLLIPILLLSYLILRYRRRDVG